MTFLQIHGAQAKYVIETIGMLVRGQMAQDGSSQKILQGGLTFSDIAQSIEVIDIDIDGFVSFLLSVLL